MIDSDFWRELAAEFSAHSTSHANLHAAWQYTLKSGTVGDWRVNGDPTQRSEFEALARRAAIRLSNKRSPDLLITWLEALREDGFGFRLMGYTAAEVGPNYMLGSIDRLFESSAHLCRKLESAALQAEYE